MLRVVGQVFRFMGTPAKKLLDVVAPNAEDAEWEGRYTTDTPADGWQKPGFDDTAWKQGMFKGMDSFIAAKTVVGEPIHIGDTIILPLVDVAFGVGAGAFSGDKKDNGGGGMTGKMTPCAVLVIQNGTTKLVNVKNQDGLTKILDMVPDFVDRFASGKGEEA